MGRTLGWVALLWTGGCCFPACESQPATPEETRAACVGLCTLSSQTCSQSCEGDADCVESCARAQQDCVRSCAPEAH